MKNGDISNDMLPAVAFDCDGVLYEKRGGKHPPERWLNAARRQLAASFSMLPPAWGWDINLMAVSLSVMLWRRGIATMILVDGGRGNSEFARAYLAANSFPSMAHVINVKTYEELSLAAVSHNILFGASKIPTTRYNKGHPIFSNYSDAADALNQIKRSAIQ